MTKKLTVEDGFIFWDRLRNKICNWSEERHEEKNVPLCYFCKMPLSNINGVLHCQDCYTNNKI